MTSEYGYLGVDSKEVKSWVVLQKVGETLFILKESFEKGKDSPTFADYEKILEADASMKDIISRLESLKTRAVVGH